MAETRFPVKGTGYGNAYVDSLVTGGRVWATSEPLKVWLGSGVDFAAAHDIHGDSDYLYRASDAQAWTSKEKNAFSYALKLYQSVSGLKFEWASSVEDADFVWWKTDLDGGALGAHELPSLGPSWGYFDPNSASWKNLHFGGDGLNTVIHELGHGLGLAHPHDGGHYADATVFPGVTTTSATGQHGLNQGIWTVMSYNTGWDRAGYNLTYGNQGGLGAFDIAALQALYGKNTSTARGNDVYDLPTRSTKAGEQGWLCVWDAGGRDTFTATDASSSVTIDLRAATLKTGDPHAGGYVSRGAGVKGGFTIAKGVVIENAYGGRYGDKLYGNSAANVLKGNGGADTLQGGGGNDVLWGGLSNDRLYGGSGSDVFVFNKKASKTTNMDRIYDFDGRNDLIHLDNAVFTKLGGTGRLKSGNFDTGSKADDRNDYLVYNKAKGILSYDADGSGKRAAVEIALLSNKAKVTAADILII